MILTGKSFKAKDVLKFGLIDALYPKGYEDIKLNEFIKKIISKKNFKRKVKKSNKIMNNIIFNVSKKNILNKTKGNYPAPLEAIKVIKKTSHQ